ncbi:MAG TPA: hypothetical protein VMC08_07785 [Bacteroidales bacterium]|nr:hypothetical protein [Bacteroidales bacterium]
MTEPRYITGWCLIRNGRVVLPDRTLPIPENYTNFAGFIKELYRNEQLSYPKFFKMDNLSKLGFLCTELALKGTQVPGSYREEETGVVLSNSGSSLDTDLAYFDTIKDKNAYFPSPSVFVYTLPNIVIGEICIRHRIKGENAFFVTEKFDAERLAGYTEELMASGRSRAVLCGWVEKLKEEFEALLVTVENRPGKLTEQILFTEENLHSIYQNNR